MTGIAYAYAAEVDGEDVKGGVGRALEDARESSDERVGTVGGHSVDHHAACSAAREGLHQRCRQSTHEVGVATQSRNGPLDAVHQHVHCARSTEHSYAYQYSNEIRNDSDGSGKSVLCALDEGVVDVHLLAHASQDEHHYDEHQQDISHRIAHNVHLRLVHLCEAPYYSSHHSRHAAEREQHCTVDEIDALVERGEDDARQCREERGEKNGHEDVGRLCCPHLRTIHHDTDGNQGESRRVEHKEHNHRIGGGVLLRIQLLQLFHSLQSERSGSVVESQHVGSHIHEDAARDGMTLRNVGKQTCEHGRQHARHNVYDAALLANLHYAEPQREYAGESE